MYYYFLRLARSKQASDPAVLSVKSVVSDQKSMLYTVFTCSDVRNDDVIFKQNTLTIIKTKLTLT